MIILFKIIGIGLLVTIPLVTGVVWLAVKCGFLPGVKFPWQKRSKGDEGK